MLEQTRTLARCAWLIAVAACSSWEGGGTETEPSSGSSGGTSTSSQPTSDPFVASFVEETEPGEAPALVRFFNRIPAPHTLWIAEYVYFNTPAGTTTEPRAIASTNVLDQLSIGLHITDRTCIMKPFESVGGVRVLEPQGAYVVRAFLSDGYHGEVVEEARSEPFTALRSRIHDPNLATIPGTPSTVVLVPADVSLQPLEFDVFSGDYPTPYTLLEAELTISEIQFFDRAGGEHVAVVDHTFARAHTVVIAGEAAAEASLIVELTAR